MNTRILTALLCAVLLWGAACSNKDQTPAGVLQPAAMQAVLKDLYLIDAVNANRLLADTSLNPLLENKKYFDQVFALHKISREQFLRSYDYYAGRPDVFRKVTDSLLAEMNRLSNEALTDTTTQKKQLNDRNIPDTAATGGN